MTIHKDGLGTIAAIWLFCGLLIYLSLHFIAYQFISYPISAILIFFMIFVFFFFRVPKRHAAEGENVVTSVADGEVVIIEKVYEKEYDVEAHRFDELPLNVYKEAEGLYVVEGQRVEKMLGYTNLESERGFLFFQNYMKEQGIIDSLKALGLSEGDTVRVAGMEFEYYD